MTDQDLLMLLEDKRPADLSAEELELLRQRLPVSAELQQLVFSDIQLEQAIAASLGRPNLTAQVIVARAQAASPMRVFAARLGWMLGIVLLALGGVLWFNSQKPPREEPRPLVAQRDKSPKDKPSAVQAPKKDVPPKIDDPEKSPAEVAATPPAGDGPKTEPNPDQKVVVAKVDPNLDPKKTDEPVVKAPAKNPPVVPMPAAVPEGLPVGAKDLDLQNWPELDPRPAKIQPVESLLTVDELPATSQNELRRWLESVPGQPHRFFEDRRSNVPVAGFEGIVKLRAPWVDKAVLRFAPFDHDQFTLHIWRDQVGVTLQYLQAQTTWVAYQTTRHGTEARPVTLALAGTDEWRYERTGQGALELRYQDETVVLSRGKLRLLTVSLPGPPTEVFLDKRSWMRSFAMSLGEPLIDDLPPQTESLIEEQPASLRWSPVVAKGIQFDHRDDGSVTMSAEAGAETVWTTVKLPRASLFEYIFQVDGPGVGTGLCFCDDANKLQAVLGCSKEKRTGWTTFGFLPKEANFFESNFDTASSVVPVTRGRQWLRIIAGPGTVKCWTSSDGRHWSRALDPLRPFRGPITSVGLVCFKTPEARSITLKQFQLRKLAALTDLASDDVVETVPAEIHGQTSDLATWLTRVIDNQPDDVSAQDWRMACAVRTLAGIPLPTLGNPLLHAILEEQLAQKRPLELQLRLIEQSALVWDTWEPAEAVYVARLYERLGQRLAREGHPQPYSVVALPLLSAPIWSAARYQAMPETLVKSELYARVAQDDWAGADELCDRLIFWSKPSNPDVPWHDQRQGVKLLVDWVAGATQPATLKGRPARRQRGRRGEQPATPSPAFKHPLVVELSKEGFNTLAEVQVALSESAFKDACMIISSVKLELALGVLPDAREGQLLVSLPQAVENSMRDFPALREMMNSEFGPTARLRVQHAIAEGNPQALQGATVQFYGTAASADAHIWLGDRAMTAGEFVTALAHYEQARRTLDSNPPALSARLRLAAALLGRDAGQPVTETVAWNDVHWSPAEFEQLVSEVRQQAGGQPGQPKLVEVASAVPAQSPSKVRYVAQTPRLKWPADLGKNPGSWPPGEVDSMSRQCAGQVVGDLLIVSNRFSVSAVDLATNTARWTHALAAEAGEAHHWHLAAMHPVVAGNRVFVRRLTKEGPDLAALDLATGAVLWKVRPLDFAASDPVLVQELLYAFSVTTAHDGVLVLSMTAINPHTGEILWQRPVVRLIDVWSRQPPCQVAAAGERLVAAVGGNVVCCDLEGQPVWVRRQTWIPLSHEPAVWDQQRMAPVIANDKVLIVQPGVLAVECLELSGGRRVWTRSSPDVRRLLGAANGRLFVESGKPISGHRANIACLSVETGGLQWEWNADPLLDAYLLAGDGSLICTTLDIVTPNEKAHPRLVWLDPKSGRELAVCPVESLSDKSPRLGPLFFWKDRLVALYGKHERDVERELIQLAPATVPALAGFADLSWKRWSPATLSPRVVAGIDAVLPGWVCLTSAHDATVGLTPESRGQTDVSATLAMHDQPVSLVRDVAVPMGRKTRLVAMVGCLPGEKWALDVRVAGRTLQTYPVEDATTANGWKELQVDLSEFAGRTVSLLVEQQHSGKPAHGQWKRLDVVSE